MRVYILKNWINSKKGDNRILELVSAREVLLSSLGWIDFDDADRQRADKILNMFSERDSRDELGLGAVRDSIADHLFPGTSTIQTKLRYMLFIPWILQEVEKQSKNASHAIDIARKKEFELIKALKNGGETKGVIGSAAGKNLKRLPSSVYWAGLKHWGIRTFPGSIDGMLRAFHGSFSQEQQNSQYWDVNLPKSPSNWLESVNFQLTENEAGFLIDKLANRTKQSKKGQSGELLSWLAKQPKFDDCDYIWNHANLKNFPEQIKDLIEHGRVFSDVMHGASLLYNLGLSRKRDNDEWVEEYEERMTEWRNNFDIEAAKSWDLDKFWKICIHPEHRISHQTKSFVRLWLRHALNKDTLVENSSSAMKLIASREKRLKGNQSRFSVLGALNRWGGQSGIYRFSYRWDIAKSHIRDIIEAA